jgi:hypothetical protein
LTCGGVQGEHIQTLCPVFFNVFPAIAGVPLRYRDARRRRPGPSGDVRDKGLSGSHSLLTGSNIATGCGASFPASGVERLVPICTGRSGDVSLGSVTVTDVEIAVWLGEAGLSLEV